MELVFKDRCGCGGQVHLFTYIDSEHGDRTRYASHGVCDECLDTVIIPPEPVQKLMPLLETIHSVPLLIGR